MHQTRARFQIQSNPKLKRLHKTSSTTATTTSAVPFRSIILFLFILSVAFQLGTCSCSVTAFTSIISIYSLNNSNNINNNKYSAKSKLFQSSSVQEDEVTSTSSNNKLNQTPESTMESSSSSLILQGELLETLTNTANSYSAAHGIQVETKTLPADKSVTTKTTKTYQMAPMSLLPQAYPRSAFTNAMQLAPSFNRLVQYVSQDSTFLVETLGGIVSQQDPYTGKLLQLHQKIYHPSPTTVTETDQVITKFAQSADQLGIIRSDYMLHRNGDESEYNIKQVELNTIASSFAGLAHKVAKLHNYLIERYTTTSSNDALNTFLMENQKAMLVSSTVDTEIASKEKAGVPFNPTLERLPLAMNVAVQRYKERFVKSSNDYTCGILFVVQEGETNTVDQRLLEFQLWETHQIPVVRLSLAQIHTKVNRNMTTGALTTVVTTTTDSHVTSGTTMEIALVYYRAGYAPTDYPSGYDESGIEWLAREMMEGSRATKCPSLGYHLAGTKKVQQELSRPGRLEQYFPQEPNVVDQMRNAFAGLYSLGDDANESDMKAVHDIVMNKNHPKYVLKPQREGGGYNFYGEQMLQKLLENVTISEESDRNQSPKITLSETLGEYILMERLFPPQQNAILLRGGNVEGIGRTISELGCFGTILVAGHNLENEGDNQINTTVIHNEYAGFLLRTKFSNVDEGGVASGFATLSSPYLF